MKRLLVGLTIGITTFFMGRAVGFYYVQGPLTQNEGISHCTIWWDPGAEPEIVYAIDPVEYRDELKEIYNAALEDELLGKRYLVVSERTSPGDWFAGVDPDKQMSGLEKETFDSYRAGNEQIKFIDDLIRDYPAVHLLKDNDSQAIFKENRNGWMEFAKRFPSAKGFIQFSAVGFNLGHTQALVSVEHQCGGVCGDGKFMLLRKTNGVWRIQRKVVTWE
jgi:hypothetical protein